MRKAGLLAGAAAVALLAASAEPRAEAEIGLVAQRDYMGATGTRVGASPEPLHFNNDVYESETVETGLGGRTALRFADGTQLQVGSNARVVLDRFLYDPDQGAGTATITFGKGVFRYVSGAMNKEGIQLNTPTAAIAVRGTIFLLWVAASGRTDIWVEEGEIELLGCGGHQATAAADQGLIVAADCSGVTPTSARSVPKDPAVDREREAGGRGEPEERPEPPDDDDGGNY